MGHRRQEPNGAKEKRNPTVRAKKNSLTLTDAIEALWAQTKPAFHQHRTWARARTLMLSMLTCLGRRTVSGLLCASGQQFADWSAAYRLFEEDRIRPEALFAPIRDVVCERIAADLPIVGSLDDTLLYKHGRKIAGASWRRDPLGPPFQTNFSWAQRFLQPSLILPECGLHSRGRGAPVAMVH